MPLSQTIAKLLTRFYADPPGEGTDVVAVRQVLIGGEEITSTLVEEERALVKSLGDDYRSYLGRVPSLIDFLPAGWRRYREAPTDSTSTGEAPS